MNMWVMSDRYEPPPLMYLIVVPFLGATE
jgi:hypothetical protein